MNLTELVTDPKSGLEHAEFSDPKELRLEVKVDLSI